MRKFKFRFVAQFLYSYTANYTIKLVNNSTAALDYMRKVRAVSARTVSVSIQEVMKLRASSKWAEKLSHHIGCNFFIHAIDNAVLTVYNDNIQN